MENKEVNAGQTLCKILDCITIIKLYSSSCKNVNDFQSSPMMVEACIFNLIQICMLSKHSLSDEVKAELGDIPWDTLYDVHDKIAYNYSQTDPSVIWGIVHDVLPILKKAIEAYL